MKVIPTAIAEVLILEPKVFGDSRGFFFESYNEQVFRAEIGGDVHFVQDNHSHSVPGVLRGLHYQIAQPQGKLVRCMQGEVFDVAVDIRRDSPTFGKWVGDILSEENKRQMWIPPGFAHGFLVLTESADVLYKTTEYYAPKYERGISWNDPDLADWPITGQPLLAEKDHKASSFLESESY